MPNLGQGGCQAIEDGFVLTDLLCGVNDKKQLKGVLQEYYRKRIVRSAVVQGMSRLSSDIIITSFSTPFNMKGNAICRRLSCFFIYFTVISMSFFSFFFPIFESSISLFFLIFSLRFFSFLFPLFLLYFQNL